ncbi:hypothetical protein Nepgr_014915 [Nepenthes gracilis]|uniref:Uncharacterized protein n=1 Tax=Nepenthes gracilis TaxID=150966 RepID=A0AAD3SLN5_NEPGR|nr:hypothetical protein Nepgr_014915 [Nepenthes gracilis]
MAGQTLFTVLTKFGYFESTVARRSAWNPTAFQAITARHIQVNSQTGAADGVANRGINEAIRTGNNSKKTADCTTEHVADKTGTAAQSVAEKAKQAAQEAWGSAKETAQKAKDSVLGKAEESKESLEETAEMVNRSMNSKNNPNC